MNIREKLSSKIKEAELALSELSDYTTVENQNALRYELGKAELILMGKNPLPVSGSRKFLELSDDERLQFALSHYVMLGLGKQEGQSAEYYGLDHALEWFRNSDSRNADDGYDYNRKALYQTPAFHFEKARKDYLLFSQKRWEQIIYNIQNDRLTKAQYEKIQKIADRESLTDVLSIWEDTWVKRQDSVKDAELYSDTAKGINFRIPDRTVRAHLAFALPEEYTYEQSFHIKQVRLVSSNGEELSIDESTSIVLDNGNKVWELNEPINVKPLQMYTLHFQVNQRNKLREGIQVILTYEDVSGEQCGSFSYEYNRKAWYPVWRYNLDMQCNAICYAVTGKIDYAYKTMYQMLLFMDDFCQGAEYWMVYDKRPEGRDNYGAVQAGRDLCVIAMTYAFIKDAPVWEDKKLFVQLAEYMLNYVLDLRDRTCLTQCRAQKGTGNWQTDMCIGAAMLAAALEEIPYRKQWIINAQEVLSAQLTCNLNEDGSWPESLRYHHAVLEHFCLFAHFWEHETGENWSRKYNLERMFAYSIGVQMPPYQYFSQHISTPPFGDHKLRDGQEYEILAAWIDIIKETNQELAMQMQETWVRAGRPVPKLGGESVAAELLLISDRAETEASELNTAYRENSQAYEDAGVYIYRKNHINQRQSYLAVMCNQKRIGHGHCDQGSFIYYYDGVPVIMDPGIEGYFDATTQWYISSYSHACMLFQAKKQFKEDSTEINLTAGNYSRRLGWCDTPETMTLLSCDMNKGKEHIRMRIANPEGEGHHIRTISFDIADELIVCDKVVDYQGDILFCLPMLMKDAHIDYEAEKAYITGTGYYGVDLEIKSLSLVKKAWIEMGRVTPMNPCSTEACWIPFLRMVADAAEGFEVVIKAKRS